MTPPELRIAVSNSHVHLSAEHARALFGTEAFAGTQAIGHAKFEKSRAVVAISGPKGTLERVRVLSPCTRETWVELNRTDAFRLGVEPPLEEGELGGEGVELAGPQGAVRLGRNVVLERRHLELTAADAARFGLRDGQTVSAEIDGPRALVFKNVAVRVLGEARDGFESCLELDRDEANAALVRPGDRARIVP